MQRIELPALKLSALSDHPQQFTLESGQFSASTESVPYALFAPLHYEPGYAYPLIVWLHGEGSDERHLMRVMPQISMRNYVAIAPRGLGAAAAAKRADGGFGWRPIEQCVEDAGARVEQCIALARQRFNIAARKVFLAGFDSGGTIAFRIAMDQPERFAGVLSLCGRFPAGRAVLGNLVAVRRLPVFLTAGRLSAEYTAEEVCENLRLLHSAGLSITLRQYPGGHELSPSMLGDMDRWIIDQVVSPAKRGRMGEGERGRTGERESL